MAADGTPSTLNVLATDSPYDDAYSPGYRRSREEWYGKFVTVMPIR